MEKIRAVIFDCDGTLVDSEELGFRVIAREALRIGVPLSPGEELIALRGRSMATCIALLSERLGRPLPTDFEATLRAAMAQEFRSSLRAMPGVTQLLPLLKIPYCVATNGPRSKTELTLGICGLLPFFGNRIVSAYEVGYYKPDPGLFMAAARKLGMRPNECAVVEDSVPGMQAAVTAGMAVYAVRGAVNVPEDLRNKVSWLDHITELAAESWNL